jgi:DNA recombination protein RmuC
VNVEPIDPGLVAAGATGLLALAASFGAVSLRRDRALRASIERLARAEALAEGRIRHIEGLEQELGQARTAHEQTQQRLATCEREHAALGAELAGERRSAQEKQGLLREAEQRLREAFQALSAEALRQNSRSFLDLARTSLGEHQRAAGDDLEARRKAIDALVAPIQESLGRVDAKLQLVEKEREGHYKEIAKHMELVASSQRELQAQTGQLVRALRNPSVRGRWGEIQLRRVVEMAGMLDHCDFQEQPSAQTDDGRLRPDLIVRLPGGKHVVIDAKAPLDAYLNALDCADESERTQRLRDHARQVRAHMEKLARRSYWSQFEPTPEFVVMFLPGETFFSAALQHDASLLEYGVGQHVIVASPTTLIALLRAVAYGWRQERIARSAEEISQLGRTLHDRLASMTEHFARLGRQLGGAVSAYNQTLGSLESRVLRSARRFRELGASAGDELPVLEAIERAPRPMVESEPAPFPVLHAVPGGEPDSEAELSPRESPVERRALRSGESG